MTRDQINALTEADVAKAREATIAARITRSGVSTVDYVLAQVGGRMTLDHAKQHLLGILNRSTLR